MRGQEYFCIRRGLLQKKKLFSELEEKKKMAIFECQLRKCVLPCKEKKTTKQGFRVIYINVELLHYFLI